MILYCKSSKPTRLAWSQLSGIWQDRYKRYPLNSTRLTWSHLSGIKNLTGQLVTMQDLLIGISIYI